MTTIKAQIMAVMECRHWRVFDSTHVPPIGDNMYCFRCKKFTTCVAHNVEFRIVCKGCKWSRSYGRSKLNAEIAASRHHQKNPEHEIWMAEGPKVIHKWKAQPNALFGLSKISAKKRTETLDLPPF